MKLCELLETTQTLNYNNWVRFTPDSLESDWSEYKHKEEYKWRGRAARFAARFPLFKSKEQFQQALENSPIVKVDSLAHVENLTHNDSLTDIAHIVSGYQHPRDVDRIVDNIRNNVNLPLPIILQGDQGRWIMAGNTRQAVARVLGAEPMALLVDVSP